MPACAIARRNRRRTLAVRDSPLVRPVRPFPRVFSASRLTGPCPCCPAPATLLQPPDGPFARLTADEAERVGLIHRAVDPDRLLPESLAYAEKLAKWSPMAVRNIKRAIYEGLEMPFAQSLELEMACFYETMTTEAAKEALDAGIRAYAEGREPRFE